MQSHLAKRIAAAAAVAVLATLSPLSASHGDQHQSSAREQFEETYDAIADYTHEQKANVVSWFERRMDDVEARKEKLAARSSEMRRDAEKSFEELGQEIDARTDDARRELQDLKDASAEAWESAKTDMKAALDRLEQAVDSADEGGG